jgi:hypothetical protein
MEAASPTEADAEPSARPSLSLAQRSWAVFARPTAAWDGLETRVQWWFPLLVVTLVSAAVAAVLHDRAVIPMLTQAWQEQVANGQMPADQAAQMEQFFRSPQGLLIGIAQQCVVLPVIQFATALIVWFGVGFILGRPFGYRLALEVTTWAGLVTIPAQLLTAVLAWSRETLRGIHVGFGILLPDTETPSRLAVWLGAVLDALGPLAVWYVVVMILGAAALSGAPRKGVAWVLGSLYLVLVVFVAALGAMFSRS